MTPRPSGSGSALRPVREAVAEDVETLVEHRHKMFEDMRPRTKEEHAIGDRTYGEWLKRMMKEGRAVFFISTNRAGAIVASGGVWFREKQPRLADTGSYIPYLLSMYTSPRYRRKGYATSILDKMEERCRSLGYDTMTLHASEMGRGLYSSLGWERGWEMFKRIGPGEGKGKPARSRHS